MKIVKKIFIILVMIIAVTGFINPMTVAGARTYQITFRAGAHGTFIANNDNKITINIAANERFPDIPEIKVEEGYYLIGWNKDLPSVDKGVTGAMTYVAKYRVLTNGREYSINYVNQDNVEIATTRVMMAPLGTIVTERAKTIAGHELIGAADLSIMISENNNSITYVYRDLNVTKEYVETVVTIPVTLPPNVAVSTTPANGETVIPTQPEETEDVTEPATPLAPGADEKEEIPDNQTPLSKGENKFNYTYLLTASGIILVLIGIGGLIIRKKRIDIKNEKD